MRDRLKRAGEIFFKPGDLAFVAELLIGLACSVHTVGGPQDHVAAHHLGEGVAQSLRIERPGQPIGDADVQRRIGRIQRLHKPHPTLPRRKAVPLARPDGRRVVPRLSRPQTAVGDTPS